MNLMNSSTFDLSILEVADFPGLDLTALCELPELGPEPEAEEIPGEERMALPELPEETIELILGKVPFESVISWRRVCKRWDEFIGPGAWTPQVRSEAKLPILVKNRFFPLLPDVSKFRADRNEWERLKLSSVKTVSKALHTTLSRCSSSRLYKCATATRLGLLFMSFSRITDLSHRMAVIVCNPVTGSSKSLHVADEVQAAACKVNLRLAGVYTHPREDRYKLLLAAFGECARNEEERSNTYAVYDSESDSWRLSSSGPKQRLNFMFSRVSCGPSLYFLHGSLLNWKRPLMGKYNFETDTWTEISNLPLHVGPEFPQLVEQGGRVLYVAVRYWRVDFTPQKSWCFYRLHEDMDIAHYGGYRVKLCIKERGMPSEVYQRLSSASRVAPSAQGVACAGSGDLIYFYGIEPRRVGQEHTGDRDSYGQRRFGRSQKCVLVHNFTMNSWNWLPDYVHPADEMLFVQPSFRPV